MNTSTRKLSQVLPKPSLKLNNTQILFKDPLINGKDIDSDLTKQETPGRALGLENPQPLLQSKRKSSNFNSNLNNHPFNENSSAMPILTIS